MKTRSLLFFALLCGPGGMAQFVYPASHTVDSASEWYNIVVKDPYRWLENLQSPEVQNWYKMQATFTDSILNQLPQVDGLFNELSRIDVVRSEQKRAVTPIGNSIFYVQVKQGDDKYKLYRQAGDATNSTVIASPDMWGRDYNIVDFEVDPGCQYIAVIAQQGGQEKREAKIYSVAENKILPDEIAGDFKGFLKNKEKTLYYLQLPSYDPHARVNPADFVFKKHVIGTRNTSDELLTSKETNPEIMNISDGRYIWRIQTFPGCVYEFAWRVQGAYAEVWFRNPGTKAKWQKLFDASDIVYNIFYYNNRIYYSSFKNATNGTVQMKHVDHLPDDPPTTILAEQPDPLDYFAITQTKNYLIVPLKKNGVTGYSKFIHLPSHKITASPFVENTANTEYFGTGRNKNDSLIIRREGWIDFPQTSVAVIGSNKEGPYQYGENQSLPFAGDLLVEELEVPSFDGTLVPVTIIRRKDLQFNGNNVAIVNGYGAYGESIVPFPRLPYVMLAKKGVVICFVHVRGGGEKGNDWHMAGMKQTKPNSWKDFNSCAEYLVNKGYTSAGKLACEGGSAGGILIGRAVTERPELWACALSNVGVLNIARLEYSASGKSQTDEYGSVDNINEFFSLLECDALLHVQKNVQYPAMLITTGWDDPRVSCWQSAKFAAAVQNATASGKPVLLKVNFNGGHFGDMTDKQAGIKEQAMKYAFVLWQCGFEKANKYE